MLWVKDYVLALYTKLATRTTDKTSIKIAEIINFSTKPYVVTIHKKCFYLDFNREMKITVELCMLIWRPGYPGPCAILDSQLCVILDNLLIHQGFVLIISF